MYTQILDVYISVFGSLDAYIFLWIIYICVLGVWSAQPITGNRFERGFSWPAMVLRIRDERVSLWRTGAPSRSLRHAVVTMLLTVLLLLVPGGHAWVTNRQPNTDVSYVSSAISTEMKTFKTLNKSNNFKLLLTDDDSMLVGGRNTVYDINMATLQQNTKIEWKPVASATSNCENTMKTKEQCQNYIRVIAKKSENELLVCGTHASSPKCRSYRKNYNSEYMQIPNSEESGRGMCPSDPNDNSTAVFAEGRLYSGTVEATSKSPLIYRHPIMTDMYNSMWLNDPHFVGSYEYQDMVYFFLRETAVEYINCGKAVFSRVARVCKKDNGNKYTNEWTSFFKARLNCSIPGEFPFYFNEIQSTSDIGKGSYKPSFSLMGNDMVYSVFTTPGNSITGSAICAYRFSDIIKSFEGKFKEQKSAKNNWLPVPANKDLTKCVNDSKQLDSHSLTFIKTHTIMDSAVPTLGGRPLLVNSGTSMRYTQIAIDWQVLAVDRRRYDVMFIGTNDGRVLKAVNTGKNGGIDTVIIEDILVFSDKSPIVNLKVYRNLHQGVEKLIVLSKDEIKSIPLARCHTKKTCGSCIGLQDPYCSWIQNKNKCDTSKIGLQNIDEGKHDSCSDSSTTDNGNDLVTPTTSPCPSCAPCLCTSQRTTEAPPTTTTTVQKFRTLDLDKNKISTFGSNLHPTIRQDNKIPNLPESPEESRTAAATSREGRIYSALELAISVLCSIILSLFFGILIGYRVSVCRRSRFHSDTPHMDRATEIRKNHQKAEMSPYVNINDTPYKEVQKQLNVVLNLPPKGMNNLPNGSAENKVQAKGKKVYL